jgi:acetyltransferase
VESISHVRAALNQSPIGAYSIECWTAFDGTPLCMRPVHSDDVEALEKLYGSLSHDDRRLRFHGGVNGLTAATLRRMASTEPDREVALVIAALTADGESLVADARCVVDDNDATAECALVVAPPWRRLGLGGRCIRALCSAAEQRGLRRLYGSVLAENAPMLSLIERCGFRKRASSYDARLLLVERNLGSSVVPLRLAVHS